MHILIPSTYVDTTLNIVTAIVHFQGVSHGIAYLERKRSTLPGERAVAVKLVNEAVEQCLQKDSMSSVKKPKKKRMKSIKVSYTYGLTNT